MKGKPWRLVYGKCIISCLYELSASKESMPTSKLRKYFLNNLNRTLIVLKDLERQKLITRSQPIYNTFLWKITPKGRQLLTKLYNDTKTIQPKDMPPVQVG
jgi:CTP-dependent riboflavin kinase